jgi:hypothetical protein
MQDVFVTSRMCGCNDPAWLVSFLAKCLDDADVARSLLQLRKNSPEKFQRTKERPSAPPARYSERPGRGGNNERCLEWAAINRLVRDAGAIDRPMLSSLRWYSDERTARAAIRTLRTTHPAIWQRRVTPFEAERVAR